MSAPPYPNTSAPPAYGGRDPNATNQPTPQPPGLGQNHIPPDTRGTNRAGAQPNHVHSHNNCSSHGTSGFNGPSSAANHLNIDPALLQPPHGGNPPRPASNVNNFFPGSRPVFHFQNQYQSGVSHLVQSPPSLPGNEDQATADARLAEFEREFTHIDSDASDSSPNENVYKPMTPADGANPSHMNSKSTYDAQPLSQIDMIAGTERDNNPMVNFQQNGGYHAALPQTPYYGHMNNTDDHDASAAQESIEAADDARPILSMANKRRRPAQDDGSSIGSFDRASEGLREAQLPDTQTRRKPAKRAKTTTPVASIEVEETMQSSTAQATIKAQNQRLPAAQKMSRRQSLAVADYSGVKVATDELQGMTYEEAQDVYVRRISLRIKGDDNVDEVKAEPGKWIRAIMETFDAPYNEIPEMKNYKEENFPEFNRWQKEHHALTMEILQNSRTPNLAEATATVIYYDVVDAHEKGTLIESSGMSFTHELELTCKARLERIIGVLKALTIIRRDIVLGSRLNELVAGPGSVLKRKEENKQENDKKADKKTAAKKAKDEVKAEKKAREDTEAPDEDLAADKKAKDEKKKAPKKTKAKAKSDNKRGGKGKAAVVENDEKSNSDSGEKDRASIEGASNDADRSEPVSPNDSIFVPGRNSVDDESGAYEGAPEVDGDSVDY